MKKAIITGICGQDGAYLARFLLDKGYHVIGWARRNKSRDNLRILDVLDAIEIVDIDICDTHHVYQEIARVKPDEIYNLAAQSHVGMSFKNPQHTCNVNYSGYLNILYAARIFAPKCRIYQAGTSEMFGYAGNRAADESTPFMPMSPYAISKVAAHWAGVNARYESDQFVANGILFNHESPIRGGDFVTAKIINFIHSYEPGKVLYLGNMDSIRDWGFAGDYVEAMWLMLQHSCPEDFVVATGNSCSVRRFLTMAFEAIGKEITFEGVGYDEKVYMDGNLIVEVSKDFYRPNDLSYLKGNPSKIHRMLGWKPNCDLRQLVERMVLKNV